MKKVSILLAFAVAMSVSGCSVGTSVETFAEVIKEESPNFLQGKDLLVCNVNRAIGGNDCSREIELMVFASQRIVKKLEGQAAPTEIASLVQETIQAMKPVADSGFETSCVPGLEAGSAQFDECTQARIKIAGDKQYALQDVWDSLDAWQPYF